MDMFSDRSSILLTSTKKTNRPYSYAVCFTVKKHIHVLYDFIKDFYGSIIYSGVIFLVILKTHSPKIDHLKAYMQDINGRIYEATLDIAKTADGRNVLYPYQIQNR